MVAAGEDESCRERRGAGNQGHGQRDDADHLGFKDIGTPEFEKLHRRIHDLLFADKIETALATEIRNG